MHHHVQRPDHLPRKNRKAAAQEGFPKGAVRWAQVAGPQAQQPLPAKEVGGQQPALQHTGEQRRDGRAPDAQGRRAEEAKDQKAVQKDIGPQRRESGIHPRPHLLHRAQRTVPQLADAEEGKGERQKWKILPPLPQDARLPSQEGEHCLRRQKRGHQEKKRQGKSQGKADAVQTPNGAQVPPSPVLGSQKRDGRRDAGEAPLKQQVDLAPHIHAGNRRVAQLADHHIVRKVHKKRGELLAGDGQSQVGHSTQIPPGGRRVQSGAHQSPSRTVTWVRAVRMAFSDRSWPMPGRSGTVQ